MGPQQIEVNGTMIDVIDAINVEPIRKLFFGLPVNDDVSRDAARQRYRSALTEVCSHADLVFGSGKVGLRRINNERKA